MNKIFLILIFLIISSCNNIEFVYQDNKTDTNPLYGKTKIETSGMDITFIKSYVPSLFGKTDNEVFKLLIEIKEKKTKRSVETNQATSNLNYELKFIYTLRSDELNCVIYTKEILSNFAIIPKSSGYNFGTDSSLERKYELAVTENLNQFVSLLPNIVFDTCL
mgnify:CR=1 FL=1|tara:strand:- start:667 stop:1155 length:489 start_codon:yes stop_codon:yes gene_type:complete